MPIPKDPNKYDDWKRVQLDNLKRIQVYRSGKTYEDIYGLERAKEIRKKVGDASRGRKCFWKGKKLSEEHKRNISENAKVNPNYGMKGKPLSEEHKRKIGLASKGRYVSEETKLKSSIAHKGQHNSPTTEFKKGHSLNKGRKLSYEHKRKMSEFMKGRLKIKENHPMYGKHHNEETRLKMNTQTDFF